MLPNRVAYALAASVIGLGLFASITPSPLYHAYSELWHFSPLTLTLVYATYAFGVLASLLLVGGVSDDVGRRPVLLVSLGGLIGATVLFLVADSAAWLFAARAIQGVSTGAALSARARRCLTCIRAAIRWPPGSPTARRPPPAVGLGILVSSSLVRIGWEPRVLPYALLLVLAAIAFAGAYWMPEPVSSARASRTPNPPQRNCPSRSSPCWSDSSTAPRPGGTVAVAHRQGPLRGYVLLPLAAPHPAGRSWSHHGPPTGQAALALSRRWSRPDKDDL